MVDLSNTKPEVLPLIAAQIALVAAGTAPAGVGALADQVSASKRDHPSDNVIRAASSVSAALVEVATTRSGAAADRVGVTLRVLRIQVETAALVSGGSEPVSR
jgi:hypothetical protein